ncbi:MAG: nucleotidyltransferase domain-containing protein [Caldilineaceae bacterium]
MTTISLPNRLLSEVEQQALQTFVSKVCQRFPDQILTIYLFGSRARGDARPDSDMDLLVILKNADLATRRSIRDLAIEVWLSSGIYLSTRVWDELHRQQHADLHTAFYKNLQQDAVSVL